MTLENIVVNGENADNKSIVSLSHIFYSLYTIILWSNDPIEETCRNTVGKKKDNAR